MKRYSLLLSVICCCFFVGAIKYVDRLFFKKAHSFCAWFLFSEQPADPDFDFPPLSADQKELLDQLCVQKFTYLAKGNHCFVFSSDDGQYILKFHKYPSFYRPLSWLAHPLGYLISKKRGEIRRYSAKRVYEHHQSYKNSFCDLQEESGLLMVHINKSSHLQRTLTLVDRAGGEVKVPLDKTTFLIQKKAELFYPTLQKLYRENRLQEAKEILAQVVQLIVSDYNKGYQDQDPDLGKNYGLLPHRAMHIDVGDLARTKEPQSEEGRKQYLSKILAPLQDHLAREYPLLASEFQPF